MTWVNWTLETGLPVNPSPLETLHVIMVPCEIHPIKHAHDERNMYLSSIGLSRPSVGPSVPHRDEEWTNCSLRQIPGVPSLNSDVKSK